MRFARVQENGGRLIWGGVVLLAALLFAIEHNSGGMPFFRDRLYYFLPQYAACRESLAAGSVPLWNPYMHCGQPLLATWQVALASPLGLPFLIWPFPIGMKIFWFMALVCAAGGMYALGLTAGLAPFGASVAAIVYIGAGPIRSLGEWPNIVACLSFLPAFLVMIAAASRARTGAYALVALFFGMLLLAGQPRQVVISALTTAGWLAALATSGRRREISWRALTISMLAGVGIALIQLLPSFELLLFSERLAEGVPKSTIQEGFLAPKNLMGILCPNWHGREGHFAGSARILHPQLYLGALAVTLAVIGLFHAPRVLRLFFLLTIVPAIILATAEPIASLALALLKSDGMLRYMSHFIMAAFPALSLLAGVGAERTAKGASFFSGKSRLPAIIFSLLLIPALAPGIVRGLADAASIPLNGIDHETLIRRGLAVNSGIFIAAWLVARFRASWIAVLLPPLLFIDFVWALHGFEAKAPETFFSRPAALDRWKLEETRGFSPVWLVQALHAFPADSFRSLEIAYRARYQLLAPNVPQVYGIRNASGYEPFCLALSSRFFSEYSRNLDSVADALRLAAVNWVIAPTIHVGKELPAMGEIMPGWKLLRVPDPSPFAAVVPSRFASVDWRLLLRAPHCGSAELQDEGSNAISVEVDSLENSLLYIASFWIPGWKAKVNGSAPHPAFVNGAGFISVPLPRGKSIVHLTYAPFSFALGLLVSSGFLAGFAFLAVFSCLYPGRFASRGARRGKYQALRKNRE